ncbi:MAG: hypothetical protein BJ554DRAFT_1749 [Olpidium bornovanus]|uniref:Uncharacterized protein n=1 Tax=Olpidium bornovanus TaxID=278681 RepID=A0A8H7ZRZ6_9FUNG|nr:MAG: hypothetical protein BJ554DRAFT_1749 [Olpidium bornovanus]
MGVRRFAGHPEAWFPNGNALKPVTIPEGDHVTLNGLPPKKINPWTRPIRFLENLVCILRL